MMSLFTFCYLALAYSMATSPDNKSTTSEDKKVDTTKNIYVHDGGGRLDINIVDLDKNIAKVCERLKNLDKALTKIYEDPQVSNGNELMILLRTYNQACLDLLYFCSLDKLKALKAADDILDHGGPKFFDVDIDEKRLQETFNWDNKTLEGMYILKKNTYEHWFDLWHLYNNLPG